MGLPATYGAWNVASSTSAASPRPSRLEILGEHEMAKAELLWELGLRRGGSKPQRARRYRTIGRTKNSGTSSKKPAPRLATGP